VFDPLVASEVERRVMYFREVPSNGHRHSRLGIRVLAYAEIASVKRSYQQAMLRFAVKARSAKELLNLHNGLESLRPPSPDNHSQVNAA
jgi:hypothetical protein